MERAEAERMEADYNRAYAEFSVKHAQNAPLVEALKKVGRSMGWGICVAGDCSGRERCLVGGTWCWCSQQQRFE